MANWNYKYLDQVVELGKRYENEVSIPASARVLFAQAAGMAESAKPFAVCGKKGMEAAFATLCAAAGEAGFCTCSQQAGCRFPACLFVRGRQ